MNNGRAFFPGSFDPFTKGHFNIFLRALNIFDHIVIGVGHNSLKKGFFDINIRKQIIDESIDKYFADSWGWFREDNPEFFKRWEIIDYNCLTVEACKQYNCRTIIRGVRNMLDFENERAIADANKKINDKIDTIIIPTEQEFGHISSTAVRDLLLHKDDIEPIKLFDFMLITKERLIELMNKHDKEPDVMSMFRNY